jgi:hypothetical protein
MFYCHHRLFKGDKTDEKDPRWVPLLCNNYAQDRGFKAEYDAKHGKGSFRRFKYAAKKSLDKFWDSVNEAVAIDPDILVQFLSLPSMAEDILSKTVVPHSFDPGKGKFD